MTLAEYENLKEGDLLLYTATNVTVTVIRTQDTRTRRKAIVIELSDNGFRFPVLPKSIDKYLVIEKASE